MQQAVYEQLVPEDQSDSLQHSALQKTLQAES
jgi:hypothetical protein